MVTQMNNYFSLFEQNPFGEETILAEQLLISLVSETKRDKSIKLMGEINMSRTAIMPGDD